MARALRPCGTPAAYQRHLRHLEVPCDACSKAEARRSAAYRAEVAALKAAQAARRAVLAAAVYTGKPRRGVQGATQRAQLRGEL
jgi:hypothetical protein